MTLQKKFGSFEEFCGSVCVRLHLSAHELYSLSHNKAAHRTKLTYFLHKPRLTGFCAAVTECNLQICIHGHELSIFSCIWTQI